MQKIFFSDVENITEDIEEENLVYEENTDVEQLKETEPKNEKEELYMLMNILLKQQDLLQSLIELHQDNYRGDIQQVIIELEELLTNYVKREQLEKQKGQDLEKFYLH